MINFKWGSPNAFEKVFEDTKVTTVLLNDSMYYVIKPMARIKFSRKKHNIHDIFKFILTAKL